ncbi:hypothetical protein ABVF61_21475 [Roseibium sp. HPY-6]|uniref:glycosyltransferase family 39 protein n=1 Tax=Roseibium sp. HPY-6 TaxID=3229852 RepID=UPI00338D37E7
MKLDRHIFYENRARLATAFVFIVMIFAFLVRFHNISTLSFWQDEGYSAWFSDQSWHYLWTKVPTFETQPVLYYSILKLWRNLGSDETTLRLLSTLFSVASIPFVAATAWICAPRKDQLTVTVLASFLFAMSETQIRVSHDVRSYSMMSLSLATTLFSVSYLLINGERLTRPLIEVFRRDKTLTLALALLGLGMAMLAWSHNIGIVYVFLFTFFLFFWWIGCEEKIHTLTNLTFAGLIALIAYFPALFNSLSQVQGIGEHGFWMTPPSAVRFAKDAFGLAIGKSWAGLFIFPLSLLGICFLFYSSLKNQENRARSLIPVLLVLTAFLPMITTAILSYLWQPIYLRRTFEASQIALIIGCSVAPVAIGHFTRRRWKTVTVSLIAMFGVASAFSYHSVVANPDERRAANFRKLVARVMESAEPGSKPTIVASPNSVALPIMYYEEIQDTEFDLRPVPGPFPATKAQYVYPAGNTGVPAINASMVEELSVSLQNVDTIWLVERQPWRFDQDRHVGRYIESAFPCILEKLPPYATKRQRRTDSGKCEQ